MQDRYMGDVGDFVKYGLPRAIRDSSPHWCFGLEITSYRNHALVASLVFLNKLVTPESLILRRALQLKCSISAWKGGMRP